MSGKKGRSGRRRAAADLKVHFNSRIDPKLREQLQSEADKNGRTLSNEIEIRLRRTLRPQNPTTDATRVLTFLLEEAARRTAVGDRTWFNDEDVYMAWRYAVRELLDIALVPRMKWRRPEEREPLPPPFKGPDDLGRAAVFLITNELMQADDIAKVASLQPDDPRREYSNAAHFLSTRAARWVKDERRRRAIESDPEYEALRREMREHDRPLKRLYRLAPEEREWMKSWHERMEAVYAKHRQNPDQGGQ